MLWGAVGFFAGVVLGSCVKALADRSLESRSFWGRSHCPKCQHQLHWYDLFPIVSYLILRGKCRYCHKTISIEYLLVEVVMGILIGYLFYHGFNLELIFKVFFVSILSVLFLTDLKKMLIPNRIVMPAIVIVVAYLLLVTLLKVGYLYYYLLQTRTGQLLLPPHSDYFQRHALIIIEPLVWAVVSSFLIAGFFYGLILITKGKGMGGGDVSLGALIGFGLGFPNAILALVLSFLLGALVSLFLIFLGKKKFGQTIPFGPFLVTGSLIALFWGSRIVDWYLHLGT